MHQPDDLQAAVSKVMARRVLDQAISTSPRLGWMVGRRTAPSRLVSKPSQLPSRPAVVAVAARPQDEEPPIQHCE